MKMNSRFTYSLLLTRFIAFILFSLSNAKCPQPQYLDDASPKNATSPSGEYTAGTVVVYQCDAGFRRSTGLGISKCQASGKWTYPDIECEAISCGNPESILNGKSVGNVYHFGATVNFECFPGYSMWSHDGRRSLQTSPLIYCNANGFWIGEVPLCLPIECPELKDIANGFLTISSREYGGKAAYSCATGFQLQKGEIERYCELDGTWSGDEPVCEGIKCEDPESENFLVKNPLVESCRVLSSLESGGMAKCICTKYRREETIRCLKDGQWEASCAVKCSKPKPPENTVSSRTLDSGYEVGASICFECKKKFLRKKGTSGQSQCEMNGEWTVPSIVCEEWSPWQFWKWSRAYREKPHCP